MYISASMVSNTPVDLNPTMDSNTATPYNSDVYLKHYYLLNSVMDPNIITASSRIEDNNDAHPYNTSTWSNKYSAYMRNMFINISIALNDIVFSNSYPTLYTTPPSLNTCPTALSIITIILCAYYSFGTPSSPWSNTNYFFTINPLQISNRTFPASVTIILPEVITNKNPRYFKQTSTQFYQPCYFPVLFYFNSWTRSSPQCTFSNNTQCHCLSQPKLKYTTTSFP